MKETIFRACTKEFTCCLYTCYRSNWGKSTICDRMCESIAAWKWILCHVLTWFQVQRLFEVASDERESLNSLSNDLRSGSWLRRQVCDQPSSALEASRPPSLDDHQVRYQICDQPSSISSLVMLQSPSQKTDFWHKILFCQMVHECIRSLAANILIFREV